MHVFFGLGNPGARYRRTRHNAGLLVLEYLEVTFNIPFRPGKGDYYFGWHKIFDEQVLLIKPVTFMNNSGLAVAQVVDQYELDLERIMVIHDDFHLPFGTLRFRAKGSAGGHNGIKSIIYHLQSEAFPRLKIGIGEPLDNSIDYVLSDFSASEQKYLSKICEYAYVGLKTWVQSGIEEAMNRFNGPVIDTGIN